MRPAGEAQEGNGSAGAETDGKRAATAASAAGSFDSRVKRSRDVRLWLSGQDNKPANLVGLALSGGGIRSATFSLGLLQSLAKSRDALSKIDILSTVSGGGYAGCFLRSLFVPSEGRGIAPPVLEGDDGVGDIPLNRDGVEDQWRFAREVLNTSTDTQKISWPSAGGGATVRRNPLWWLREHSRYLAPNGATDYGFAAAYLTRNWLAMLYIFFIASLALVTALVVAEAAIARYHPGALCWTWSVLANGTSGGLPGGGCATPSSGRVPLSPIAILLALPLAGAATLSLCYWLTQAMSPNEPSPARQWRNLAGAILQTIAGALIIGALIYFLARWFLKPVPFPTIPLLEGFGPGFAAVIAVGVFIWALAVLVTLALAAPLLWKGALPTGELRRRLTNLLAKNNRVFLVIAAVAVVDSAGAYLDSWFRSADGAGFGGGIGVAMVPALAFLLQKIPDWFSGTGKSAVGAFLRRFASPVAAVAGIVLYGMVAIAAAALAHHIAWPATAWIGTPEWPRLALFAGIVLVLGVLSGRASGFINLSSLHLLYSSRLTRAYLGATNNQRLEQAANPQTGSSIRDNDPADYIQPSLYCRADLPAPVHIINATINETIDPQSQIIARDRKGEVISLDPKGIRIGRNHVEWSKVGNKDCAEQISLGQWIAISGAAASSAMGRLTNFGFALALTFANVRLGYWWWSPGLSSRGPDDSRLNKHLSRWFGTFIYLFNEMTARYSRSYERKYLTDGGHFENSGAYRLLDHRVPLIILADSGADPTYQFADLENLVRLARLDFGAEIKVLRTAELATFAASLGATDHSIFVDSPPDTDWRGGFGAGETGPFVLVLRAEFDDATADILWIKPRLLSDLPPDLLGYSVANPLFPQQPTGDQFFDEAQWESYRKLGEITMSRLLAACPKLLA
jgi:hypothetical protein